MKSQVTYTVPTPWAFFESAWPRADVLSVDVQTPRAVGVVVTFLFLVLDVQTPRGVGAVVTFLLLVLHRHFCLYGHNAGCLFSLLLVVGGYGCSVLSEYFYVEAESEFGCCAGGDRVWVLLVAHKIIA